MAEVRIYTDGACRGNPGPGGWGALLRSGRHHKEIRGGESHTTNNRMELTAAIEALCALKQSSSVNVYTDSQYLRLGITKWLPEWKQRGWRTASKSAVKNEDLWRRLDELTLKHDVRWYWVKGHSGHSGNERADKLANQAIDELISEAQK
jgi:ribonuclease HI